MNQLIPTLNQHGVCAACIKPGRFLGTMPASMISLAKKLSFPLIELPDDVRFADITKAVSDEIMHRQQTILRKSLSVNDMLAQMITAGAGLQEIVKQISTLMERTVMIYDRVNNRTVYHIWEKESSYFGCGTTESIIKKIRKTGQEYTIQLGEEDYGALYLVGQDGGALEEEMLRQVIRAIPLEIGRFRSVREYEERSFNDFFLHLISDTIIDEDREKKRADALSFELNDMYYLMTTRILDNSDHVSYQTLFKRNRFLQALRIRLAEFGFTFRIIDAGSDVYILLRAKKEEDINRIKGRMERLLKEMHHVNRNVQISIGCSRPHRGIAGLQLCSKEAELSLRLALEQNKSGFFLFDELGIIRLMYSPDPIKEAERYITETLGVLLINQTDKDNALMETLKTYFMFQGNQRKVAKELFIHYNTVAYRLEQISEKTGLDLQNYSDRLRAELALYLYEIMDPPLLLQGLQKSR